MTVISRAEGVFIKRRRSALAQAQTRAMRYDAMLRGKYGESSQGRCEPRYLLFLLIRASGPKKAALFLCFDLSSLLGRRFIVWVAEHDKAGAIS